MTTDSFPAGISFTGTNGFRLYPGEPYSEAASSALLTRVAAGAALALDYTWIHPEQGPQAGHLVVGRPDEEGSLTAAWTDSFHQAPEVRVLTGISSGEPLDAPADAHPLDDGDVELAMEYQGWGWTIGLQRRGEELALVMNNVIPEGVEGAEPGPYPVMVARWTADSGTMAGL